VSGPVSVPGIEREKARAGVIAGVTPCLGDRAFSDKIADRLVTSPTDISRHGGSDERASGG